MSDTTLEDGEIQDDLLGKSSATKTGCTEAKDNEPGVAVVKPSVTDLEDKHGMYS
jgi:hypothetical protein